MTPRFYIFASLALIVLLSGCLRGGISTEIVSTDMLNIKSIDVFPANQVQPGDTIVVRMEVENVGQEATYLLVDSDSNNTEGNKDKWNGDYLLMDHCSTLYNANSGTGNKDSDFRILSGGSCMASNDNIHLVKDSAGKDIKNGAC